MLIASPRHTARDLERWSRYQEEDAVRALLPSLQRKTEAAIGEMRAFAEAGPCYVGVSWGKDSMVVAHLSLSLGLPLVWVRVEPIVNPDCLLVRDAFLARFQQAVYTEIEEWCEPHQHSDSGVIHEWGWTARGTLERGIARIGIDRYISGIRAQESGGRKARVAAYGLSTDRTCAPIGRWTTAEVFAYLHRYNLPVHPAYACLGVWPRDRIRVSALGRTSGQGHGRWEWEQRYYGAEMRAMESLARERLTCRGVRAEAAAEVVL